MDALSLLRLLQIADSAIPIGGAAHSFGLETLAAENVLNADNLEEFLAAWLEEAGSMEAWFVRAAFRGDAAALSEELSARKPARESREASLKLGRRFTQLVNQIAGLKIVGELHYSVAFGCAVHGHPVACLDKKGAGRTRLPAAIRP